ncbi:MAG: PIN domain-containing protein [Candidatus Bathyarchaeota archaeon]|nr:PIN domain-containing protein [Candidatus Bathyarchaeum sp.]
MTNTIVTDTGKLKEELLPAMLLDTNILVEYWMTEGMEFIDDTDSELPNYELPHLQVVRDILKSEKMTKGMLELRKKFLSGTSKVTPVVTPLAILELIGWHAESAFKQSASEAAGVVLIQKRSRKQIGDYLKKTLELRKAEVDKEDKNKPHETTGLELLLKETWLNPSFTMAHGLAGLLQVDLVNFNMQLGKVWQKASAYSYLQIGLADIMHILVAQHLGCEYIASFDSDFKRVKDIIANETGISVLTSPDEILAII